MFIQGIFYVFRDTPSGFPVILCLYPDADPDNNSAVTETIYKNMIWFFICHTVFFLLQHIRNHLFCKSDIRIVRNADGNIDTSFILLCQVCQTGIGQTAIWQDNRLVINRKQLCITSEFPKQFLRFREYPHRYNPPL